MTTAGSRDVLRAYRLDQQRRGLMPGTIRRMGDNLRSFDLSLPDGATVLTATRDDVEAWLTSRGRRCPSGKISARTRYSLLSCLASFYRWAIREELTDHDPSARIDRPRLRRTLPRPISDEDLELALDLADPRMRAWLALMAYAGLRCQEVAGLQVDDILTHLDPPMLYVVKAKGGNERTVPIAEEVERALAGCGTPRSGPLFPAYHGGPFSPHTVSRDTNEYLRELGIGSTAHSLRHWFATRIYALTGDIVLVQELLGHASLATARIYVAVDVTRAAGVVRGLSVARQHHPTSHVPRDAMGLGAEDNREVG